MDTFETITRLWPTGGIVVMRGEPGSGRSWQLGAIADHVTSRGGIVLRLAGEQDRTDRFGLDLLAGALRTQFELFGDGRLARHIATIESVRAKSVRAGAPNAASPAVQHLLTDLLNHLRGRGDTLLACDDVQLIPDSIPLADACRRARCVLVAVMPTVLPRRSSAAELAAIADVTVSVQPYEEEQLLRVVAQTLGGTPDNALWTALRQALGSLGANPGTVVATVRELLGQGLVERVRGKLLLREGPVTIARSSSIGATIAALSRPDRAVLAAICARGAITVDDVAAIAADTGLLPDHVGHTVDLLFAHGLVVMRRNAEIEPLCPAMTATLTRSAITVVHSLTSSTSPTPLSAREEQIVGFIADGRRNSWIAARLRISERAVERHVTRMLARTGSRSRVELAVAHLRGQLV